MNFENWYAGILKLQEGTIPIVEINGEMITPDMLATLSLDSRAWRTLLAHPTPSRELLAERVRLRVEEGREVTINTLGPIDGRIGGPISLTPEQQLWEIENNTAAGTALLKAEKSFLNFMVRGL